MFPIPHQIKSHQVLFQHSISSHICLPFFTIDLLSTYFVPTTVLSTGDTALNKADKNPCLCRGRADNKQRTKTINNNYSKQVNVPEC